MSCLLLTLYFFSSSPLILETQSPKYWQHTTLKHLVCVTAFCPNATIHEVHKIPIIQIWHIMNMPYKISSFQLFRVKLECWWSGKHTNEHTLGYKTIMQLVNRTQSGKYDLPLFAFSVADSALQLNFYCNK